MNRFFIKSIITLLFIFIPVAGFSQLKKDVEKPDFTTMLSKPSTDFLFGFLDPNKMHMNHSFSMSYSTMAGEGMMLNSYTNMINYQYSENLLLTTELGLLTSPYNTYQDESDLGKPKFFGGAELTYKMSENSSLSLKVESKPYYMYTREPFLGRYHFDQFQK